MMIGLTKRPTAPVLIQLDDVVLPQGSGELAEDASQRFFWRGFSPSESDRLDRDLFQPGTEGFVLASGVQLSISLVDTWGLRTPHQTRVKKTDQQNSLLGVVDEFFLQQFQRTPGVGLFYQERLAKGHTQLGVALEHLPNNPYLPTGWHHFQNQR